MVVLAMVACDVSPFERLTGGDSRITDAEIDDADVSSPDAGDANAVVDLGGVDATPADAASTSDTGGIVDAGATDAVSAADTGGTDDSGATDGASPDAADTTDGEVQRTLEVSASSCSKSLAASSCTSLADAWTSSTAQSAPWPPVQEGTVFMTARHDSNGCWHVIRPFMVFELSGIPAGSRVTQAALVFQATVVSTGVGGADAPFNFVQIFRGQPLDPTAIVRDDFGRFESSTSSGQLWIDSSWTSTDTVVPLDSALLPAFVNGGLITLIVRGGHELLNEPIREIGHGHYIESDSSAGPRPPRLHLTLEL